MCKNEKIAYIIYEDDNKGRIVEMDRYEYKKSFQRKILSVILHDYTLVLNIINIIKPSYFTAPVMRIIARNITKFVKKFKTAPDYDELCNYSIKNSDGKFSDDLLCSNIKKIYSTKIKNKKYIVEQMVEFARYSGMKSAIIESADLIGDIDNRSTIRNLITDALKIGLDIRKKGIDVIKERYKRAVERALYGFDYTRISTGFKGLDRRLSGGLDCGELGCILAPPKGFKTGTLINLGFAALARRKTVVHYTFEVSEDKTAARYERRISGLTKKGMLKHPKKLDAALRRLESIGARLIVKEFPMRTVGVSDIHNHLEFLKNEGIYPDLVIVDYGDLLKPETRGETHTQIGDIYAALRALAQEFNVPVWTASQTTRKALGKKYIQKDDIADSFKKIAVSDVVIAVCQTPDERKADNARLFVAANREGAEGGIVFMHIDYKRSRIREMENYNEAA
jgi:replicative DNA helicase